MFTRKPNKETLMRRLLVRKIRHCDFNITANEGIDEYIVSYYKARKEILEEILKAYDEL